jgi:hypothetical protein
MKVEVRQVAWDDPLVADILRDGGFEFSDQIWVGLADGELCVVWGLIPPTLLSNSAYLWSYTAPLAKRWFITFAKLSKLATQRMLAEYPILYGHCKEKSHWLRWLGAEFGEKHGEYFSFTIKA